MPKLSVVVVAGKRLDALKMCLQNLRVNTFHVAEFIVVLCDPDNDVKKWAYQEADAWKAEPEEPQTLRVYKPRGNLDVYACYNYGAEKAEGEVVCFTNDDMLFCADWDKFSLEYVGPDILMTGLVVEPGVVGVDARNIKFDCGRTPAEFDSEKFATIIAKHRKPDIADSAQGWYMPVLVCKDSFLATGGYATEPPFPHPNDVAFFKEWVKAGKSLVQTHDIVVYHFQRLSQREKTRLWVGKEYRDGYVNATDGDAADVNIDELLEGNESAIYEYVYVDGEVLEECDVSEVGVALSSLFFATGETLEVEFDDLAAKASELRGASDEKIYADGLLANLFGTADAPKHMGFTVSWLTKQLRLAGFETLAVHPGHLHRYKLTATK